MRNFGHFNNETDWVKLLIGSCFIVAGLIMILGGELL